MSDYHHASLDQVEALCAVVEAGSFKGGSAALDLPTSTVSRRVAELEAVLGVRLLTRTTRSMRLTDAGQTLLSRAQPAIGALREAIRETHAGGGAIAGPLSVTMPSGLGAHVMGRLLIAWAATNPAVTLEVDYSVTNLDLLRKGIDIAFRYGPLPASSFVASRLAESRYVLACAISQSDAMHKAFGEDPIAALEEVGSVVCRPVAVWSFQRAGGTTLKIQPRPVITVNDMGLAADAVAAGLGLGLLPVAMLDHRPNDLVPIEPSGFSPTTRTLYALRQPGRHLSKTEKSLLSHVRAGLDADAMA